MLIKNIPSGQIVKTAARRNKDYELEFINGDSNNDIYTLKVFLRKNIKEKKYVVRTIIISNILAYPALDMSWIFDEDEYELASRVYHRICDEVDDIKTNFDRSMAPITIIAGQVRECLKPISTKHQQITNTLFLDKAKEIKGEPDARMSIYHGHYPKMSQEEKLAVKKFEGNAIEKEYTKKTYKLRERY